MRKFFAVTALFISSQLLAQREDTLENVTLTANKFSTKTTETGKVVVTIDRQQIEKAGSRDLAQVITELGGVYINGYTNNAGKDKSIYLRGGKVDYTLITIDGIPVYDASGIGSNFDIRNIPVDNVERIEILKGSQSTLYGSDAIAGVINIITRKGGTKTISANGILHYGSFHTWRANAGINGAIQKFDYNIGYSHVSTKGFSEAAAPYNATAPFERDAYHQNGVQANFGLQATKTIRIQPFFRYSKFSGDLDNGSFIDELDYTSSTKNWQAGIKNIIGMGKGQLNVLYQLNKTERSYLDDSALSRNGYYIYNDYSYQATENFAEAFIVYPFNKIKLTAGADFRNSSTDYNSVAVDPGFPPFVPQSVVKTQTAGDSVKQAQVGIYAALNYNHNNFAIEGGGRFNNHSEYGNNFAFNINPSYLIQKRLKVFANISTGYKTPSLYQLFSIYGNKDLKPETSLNLEGGAQVFSNDDKANLRATYFNRKATDVIAFLSLPTPPYAQYVNQDTQRDHGFELDGSLTLTDKIQLKAFYSYVTGEITTKQGSKDTTYFNLLRRPKNTIQVFVGTQITKALYASLQLNNIGERKDIYFDPVTFEQQSITLKTYTLVNFYAEYSFLQNRLKLFADLRNVFDASYTDVYGYNTAGFNVFGGLRFKF